MHTGHVTHLLSEYLDGALSDAWDEKVKSHMIFCNGCRSHLADLKRNVEILHKLSKCIPPQTLENRILTRLTQERQDPIPLESAATDEHKFPRHLSAMIIAFLAIGIVSIFIFHSTRKGPAPTRISPVRDVPSVAMRESKSHINEALRLFSPSGELSGNKSAISRPFHEIIRTTKAWETLWRNHTKNWVSPPALPQVNFTKNEIIAIFKGDYHSGEASLQIVDIEKTTWEGKSARVIKFRISKPLSQTTPVPSPTQPYIMKVVPQFKGETFFRELKR